MELAACPIFVVEKAGFREKGDGNGRVTEWFMGPVLKTGGLTPRGFESHPFRVEERSHSLA